MFSFICPFRNSFVAVNFHISIIYHVFITGLSLGLHSLPIFLLPTNYFSNTFGWRLFFPAISRDGLLSPPSNSFVYFFDVIFSPVLYSNSCKMMPAFFSLLASILWQEKVFGHHLELVQWGFDGRQVACLCPFSVIPRGAPHIIGAGIPHFHCPQESLPQNRDRLIDQGGAAQRSLLVSVLNLGYLHPQGYLLGSLGKRILARTWKRIEWRWEKAGLY